MHSNQLFPRQTLIKIEFLLIGFPQGSVLAPHAPAVLPTRNPSREAVAVKFHTFGVLTITELLLHSSISINHVQIIQIKLNQISQDLLNILKYQLNALLINFLISSPLQFSVGHPNSYDSYYYQLFQKSDYVVLSPDQDDVIRKPMKLSYTTAVMENWKRQPGLKIKNLQKFQRNRKMPQFIELPLFPEKIKKFDPMIASYGIAEECKTCHMKVLHHQSITVCACYRYCHQKCMLAEIEKQNTDKDELIFQCVTCKKSLGIHYKMEILIKPHVNKINILLLALVFTLLPILTYFSIIFQYDMIKQFICAMLIFMLLGTMGYALTNSFVVRQYEAVSIKSTQLGLVISAFLDLEKDIDDQLTQTEMLR